MNLEKKLFFKYFLVNFNLLLATFLATAQNPNHDIKTAYYVMIIIKNTNLFFAHPLIAVYCLGKAFAWTNVKLCQHLPFDLSYGIYDYSETHPADACRMDAILLMLMELNMPGEDVAKTWSEYIKIFYPVT